MEETEKIEVVVVHFHLDRSYVTAASVVIGYVAVSAIVNVLVVTSPVMIVVNVLRNALVGFLRVSGTFYAPYANDKTVNICVYLFLIPCNIYNKIYIPLPLYY
jgi:hypothetical protein